MCVVTPSQSERTPAAPPVLLFCSAALLRCSCTGQSALAPRIRALVGVYWPFDGCQVQQAHGWMKGWPCPARLYWHIQPHQMHPKERFKQFTVMEDAACVLALACVLARVPTSSCTHGDRQQEAGVRKLQLILETAGWMVFCEIWQGNLPTAQQERITSAASAFQAMQSLGIHHGGPS